MEEHINDVWKVYGDKYTKPVRSYNPITDVFETIPAKDIGEICVVAGFIRLSVPILTFITQQGNIIVKFMTKDDAIMLNMNSTTYHKTILYLVMKEYLWYKDLRFDTMPSIDVKTMTWTDSNIVSLCLTIFNHTPIQPLHRLVRSLKVSPII